MPFPPPSAMFDPLSFGLGFLAGSLFWFLLGRIRLQWQEMRHQAEQRRQAQAERRALGIEVRYRQCVLLRAQGMHLAAPLFALDEIVLPPKVLAPPIEPWPGEEMPPHDVVETTIPYLPWWPELGTTFGAPTLEMRDLLQSEAPLALLAPTGYGKTVALAYLASLLAREDERLGEKRNALPILLHVSDLALPLEEGGSPLDPILAALRGQYPDLNASQLSALIQSAVRRGTAVLLLDGYDELPPEGQQQVSQFLLALRRAAPSMLILTTLSPEQMDGLLGLGFTPLALRSWDRHQRLEFLRRWGEIWEREIAKEVWGEMPLPEVDGLLLNLWLENSLENLSPLELTLKVWGAYAGDMNGLTVQAALLAHIHRLLPSDLPGGAAEMLAVQEISNLQPHFSLREARTWLRDFEPPEAVEAENDEGIKPSRKKPSLPKPSLGAIGKLIESGLIRTLAREKVAFIHPGLGYFLAARGLAAYGMEEILASQPEWSGKWGTLTYLLAESENTELSASLLKQDMPPLYRLIFLLGGALRLVPPKSSWRGKLLVRLGKIFQDETLPFSQRAEAMVALALSGDPGSAALFRHYLNSTVSETLCLAALGSGLMRDEKATDALNALLSASSDERVQAAACLALVAIGTQTALEHVARALLHGDENIRRIAAEALANDPFEGYAALQDGLTHEDVLLRRAVVYGLARVREPWAIESLQKTHMEDEHWMVRNAAAGVLEQMAHVRSRLPRRLTPPSETPWLLEFAAKQGVGITPGSPAVELLLQVLRSGEEDQRFAALSYLKRHPDEGLYSALYPILYDPTSPLREAVYRTLWEIAWSGEKLPHPQEYGFSAA
ncbi:MAG: HEAT repeat domain-containing protein [Anaerolineales bacterium]